MMARPDLRGSREDTVLCETLAEALKAAYYHCGVGSTHPRAARQELDNKARLHVCLPGCRLPSHGPPTLGSPRGGLATYSLSSDGLSELLQNRRFVGVGPVLLCGD